MDMFVGSVQISFISETVMGWTQVHKADKSNRENQNLQKGKVSGGQQINLGDEAGLRKCIYKRMLVARL